MRNIDILRENICQTPCQNDCVNCLFDLDMCVLFYIYNALVEDQESAKPENEAETRAFLCHAVQTENFEYVCLDCLSFDDIYKIRTGSWKVDTRERLIEELDVDDETYECADCGSDSITEEEEAKNIADEIYEKIKNINKED